MVKEEFTYDSRDGKSKLHAVRYLPDDRENIRCVVQIVHGMSEYVERYEEFAGFLTPKGFVVTGEDHMGHGGSVGERGKYGYFCEQDPATVLVRDVHRLKKMTQAAYPGVPYIILGHSMGSFIVRNYMFRYGTGVNGVIIMGTGMPSKALTGLSKFVVGVQKFFCGSEHVSKLMNKLVFGEANKEIENPRTAFDWLSRDEDKVDQYIADSRCGFVFTVNGFATLFELAYRLNQTESLERIPKQLPVLMLCGAADPIGEYGKAAQKTYDSLKSVQLENVEQKLYEGARHELLNETNRVEVMNDIYRWVEEAVLKREEESAQPGRTT